MEHRQTADPRGYLGFRRKGIVRIPQHHVRTSASSPPSTARISPAGSRQDRWKVEGNRLHHQPRRRRLAPYREGSSRRDRRRARVPGMATAASFASRAPPATRRFRHGDPRRSRSHGGRLQSWQHFPGSLYGSYPPTQDMFCRHRRLATPLGLRRQSGAGLLQRGTRRSLTPTSPPGHSTTTRLRAARRHLAGSTSTRSSDVMLKVLD